MSSKTIVVCGGGGFIGGHLVNWLKSNTDAPIRADADARGRHGDRDDEIAARAQLHEARSAARRLLRNPDGGEQFVGLQRRAAIAED